MPNEPLLIDLARKETASVLARATAAAQNLDDLVDRGSQHGERLTDLSSRLWFLAGSARSIEHDLAVVYAEVRAARQAALRELTAQETAT